MNALKIFSLSLLLSVSVKAENVVIIGDSLSCGPFGNYLVQELASKKTRVTLYCTVSSSASNWLHGTNPGQPCLTMNSDAPSFQKCGGTGQVPKMDDLIKTHKDSRFILALGTNSLPETNADGAYGALAKAASVNNTSCDWIGPPHMNPPQAKGFSKQHVAMLEKNLPGFYSSLKQKVTPACKLLDSRPMTAHGTPGFQTVDGVHRDSAAGKYWADQVANEISPLPPIKKGQTSPPLEGHE